MGFTEIAVFHDERVGADDVMLIPDFPPTLALVYSAIFDDEFCGDINDVKPVPLEDCMEANALNQFLRRTYHWWPSPLLLSAWYLELSARSSGLMSLCCSQCSETLLNPDQKSDQDFCNMHGQVEEFLEENEAEQKKQEKIEAEQQQQLQQDKIEVKLEQQPDYQPGQQIDYQMQQQQQLQQPQTIYDRQQPQQQQQLQPQAIYDRQQPHQQQQPPQAIYDRQQPQQQQLQPPQAIYDRQQPQQQQQPQAIYDQQQQQDRSIFQWAPYQHLASQQPRYEPSWNVQQQQIPAYNGVSTPWVSGATQQWDNAGQSWNGELDQHRY